MLQTGTPLRGHTARVKVALKHESEGMHMVRPGPTRVLVADDSVGVRELLCLLLDMEDDFVVVGQARNGQEALALATEQRPDLVLLDLAMPVLDGLEALPRIRAVVPDATIVVFSGFESASLAEPALRGGADGYVEKGAAVTDIVERVRVLRDRREGRGGAVRLA